MKLAGGQQVSAFIEHVELWEAAAIASLAAVFVMIAGVTVLIQRVHPVALCTSVRRGGWSAGLWRCGRSLL
jgi:hypothetical protein